MNTCQHYWIVETPNGPTVGAECRKCGATRRFATAGKDKGWIAVQRDNKKREAVYRR